MNLSTKCNCCCKEDVCAIKNDYEADKKRIKAAICSSATEVKIHCKHFVAHGRLREAQEQEGKRT